MEILILSDLHCDKKALANIRDLLSSHEFDLMIIPGDLTNREPNALNYIESLEGIFSSHKTPWLAVHGNNDPPEVINFLKNNNINLHYNPYHFMGYNFVGIGGWGDDMPPYEILLDQQTIFVTHIPSHVKPGNNLQPAPNQPLIHIAGHEHHWQRSYLLGNTTIINVPSAKTTNKAVILSLPKKEVKFVDLPIAPLYKP